MPPAVLATTGTAQESASSAARPNDSLSEGSRKRSAPHQDLLDRGVLPRKVTAPQSPASPAALLGLGAVRAVADQQEHAPASLAHPEEDLEHVHDPLDRTEVRDVEQDLLARLAPSGGAARSAHRLPALGSMKFGIDVDRLCLEAELLARLPAPGSSETAVTASDSRCRSGCLEVGAGPCRRA